MDNLNLICNPIAVFPLNDGKIYLNKGNGYLFERTAVLIRKESGNDELEYSSTYINEDGEVEIAYFNDRNENWSLYSSEKYLYVGKRGETITPSQLGARNFLYNYLFKFNNDSMDCALRYLEKYFVVDKSKAEDVIKIRLSQCNSPTVFSVDTHSDFYSLGDLMDIDLEWKENKHDNTSYTTYSLDFFCHFLAQGVYDYETYLNKRLRLDIDFEIPSSPWDAYNEECILEYKQNIQLINDIRSQYLPKLKTMFIKAYKTIRQNDKIYEDRIKRRRKIYLTYKPDFTDSVIIDTSEF